MGAGADIVAGVDTTAEGPVIALLAAAEADRRGGRLHLVWSKADPATESHVRRQFPNVDLLVEPDLGNVGDHLIELSRTVTMVAVTTALAGGRDPILDRWLPDRVLTHSQCPVLVAGHGSHASPGTPGPVVVGIDGSDHSLAAARLAFEAAALRHVPVHAITAHCVPPRPQDAAVRDGQYTAAAAQANAQETLATTLAPLIDEYPQVPVTAEPTYAPDVATALIDATERADLIVVGARGRGPVTCLVLGPVSRAVVDRSPCPVLIAHAARRD